MMNVLKHMIVMAIVSSHTTSFGMDACKETEDKIRYLRYQAMTLDEKIAERIVELQKERSEMVRKIEYQAKKNEKQLSELSRDIEMLEGLIKPKAKL
jgi:hypothetical protein